MYYAVENIYWPNIVMMPRSSSEQEGISLTDPEFESTRNELLYHIKVDNGEFSPKLRVLLKAPNLHPQINVI